MFCTSCGSTISDRAVICVRCGASTKLAADTQANMQKSRVAYVLLGIFLGGFGIHNFYAGYVGRAIAQLLIVLFLGWLIIPLLAVGIWVLVEVCSVTQDSKGVAFA